MTGSIEHLDRILVDGVPTVLNSIMLFDYKFCQDDFSFPFLIRVLHWKMLQDWWLKGTLMFIQFLPLLYLLQIQFSHLKEYWKCQRPGKPDLYQNILLNFSLEFFRLQITLQNAWLLERHGCNLLQSSLQM